VKPENSGTYRCTKRDKNNNIITEDYELTVTRKLLFLKKKIFAFETIQMFIHIIAAS
jgi:hypothetical protein